MFTSDNDKNLRASLIYMIISVFLAVAGGIYEVFSFGVISYFMIYAFAVPLIGGALPYMIIYIRNKNKPASRDVQKTYVNLPDLYNAAIATLTVGSIVHGALSICGRPNSLALVYPAAAALLLTVTAILAVIRADQSTI